MIYEAGRGWFTTAPFPAKPRPSTFPSWIGPVECDNVQAEEVLITCWVKAYGCSSTAPWAARFIGVQMLLGSNTHRKPVAVGGTGRVAARHR